MRRAILSSGLGVALTRLAGAPFYSASGGDECLVVQLLIPAWGATGVAIANFSGLSLWNLGIWMYLRRTLGTDSSV